MRNFMNSNEYNMFLQKRRNTKAMCDLGFAAFTSLFIIGMFACLLAAANEYYICILPMILLGVVGVFLANNHNYFIKKFMINWERRQMTKYYYGR